MEKIDQDYWKKIFPGIPDTDADYCQWHYETVKHFRPERGMEIGFGWGYSATAYLTAHRETRPDKMLRLLSIDIDNNPLIKNLIKHANQMEKDYYEEFFFEGVGAFRYFINRLSISRGVALGAFLDWLYLDSEHDHISVFRDFTLAVPFLNDGGLLVLDDYASATAVQTLCEELKRNYWWKKPWEEVQSPSTVPNHHQIKLFRKPKGFRL